MFSVFLGVYAFLFGFSREFKFDNTPDNHCQSHRFDEFKSAFRNFSLNALFLYAQHVWHSMAWHDLAGLGLVLLNFTKCLLLRFKPWFLCHQISVVHHVYNVKTSKDNHRFFSPSYSFACLHHGNGIFMDKNLFARCNGYVLLQTRKEIFKPIINHHKTINLLRQMKSAYHSKTCVVHEHEQYYRLESNFDIVLCKVTATVPFF